MSNFEQVIEQILSNTMENSGGKLTVEQQRQLLFMMLIQQHEQIAIMGLGRQQDESGGTMPGDINAARYAIDTLRMLEHYTSGNLTDELKNYLQHKLQVLEQGYREELENQESDSEESA
jgi:hypothetical protein